MNADNFLNYKGYIGSVLFSEKDSVFHGKVIGIKSLISYEGDSVDTLTRDFKNAIDEYINDCLEHGDEPEKSFKGSFNVRVESDLHRKAAMAAHSKDISLNAFVEDAIRQAVGSL